MKFIACDPDQEDARAVQARLSYVLRDVVGDSGQSSFNADDVRVAGSVFVVGYEAGIAVACGALRPLSSGIAELKRMYAEGGCGARMLHELEERALGIGYDNLWLSTRIANERAVRFYQKHGYSPIDAYGKYVGRETSICLGKQLNLK